MVGARNGIIINSRSHDQMNGRSSYHRPQSSLNISSNPLCQGTHRVHVVSLHLLCSGGRRGRCVLNDLSTGSTFDIHLGFVVCRVIYTWFIWPLLLSPLRALPGPPLGHPILGQIPAVIKSEAGILHREWVKKYGPVVRVVGPIGMERVIFLKPEALQQILVKDWLEYPRVRGSYIYHKRKF